MKKIGVYKRELLPGEIRLPDGKIIMPEKKFDREYWDMLQQEEAKRKMLLQAEADRKKREAESVIAEEKRMKKFIKQRKAEGRPEYDEIEKELLKKYKGQSLMLAMKNTKTESEEEEDSDYEVEPFKGQFVRRRALVDQMLLDNKKTDFSYAIHKRAFYGEGGTFNSVDLAAWYRVWNQTQADKIKALKKGGNNNSAPLLPSIKQIKKMFKKDEY